MLCTNCNILSHVRLCAVCHHHIDYDFDLTMTIHMYNKYFVKYKYFNCSSCHFMQTVQNTMFPQIF